MRVLFKSDVIVVIPDTADERESVNAMLMSWDGHAFQAYRSGGSVLFRQAGPYNAVFRVPINVTSMHPDRAIRLISNFAPTPFVLDGEVYASVEGFWQSLRASNRQDRTRIASLAGGAARKAGQEIERPAVVAYQGRSIPWGSPEHWDLMRIACRAKFSQVEEARQALLNTRPRPLEHRTRRDSKSIPGVVMAGIWIGLREEFEFLQQRRNYA